jgi:uncharacterized protein
MGPERPLHVALVLTHACNLACSYCYMGEHGPRAMPRDVARRAIGAALSHGRDVDFSFFGGEPLLEWELLEDCALSVKRAAVRANLRARLQVTTNGTRLDDARVAALARLGVHVAVSIDGTREAHEATRPNAGGGSSFDAVVRGARRVRRAGLPLSVISVVAPANVRWLARSVRFLADDLGAWRVELNPAWNERWAAADLDVWQGQLEELAHEWRTRLRRGEGPSLPTFERALRPTRCDFGEGHFAIAPSGRIYPCERMVGADDASTARFVIGHVDVGIDPVRRETSCARESGSCACANVAETGSARSQGDLQSWYEALTGRLARSAESRPGSTPKVARRFLPLAAGATLALATPAARADVAEAGAPSTLRIVVHCAQGDRVLLDGSPIATWDDAGSPPEGGRSASIPVSPGMHTVRIEPSGGATIERQVVVSEGATQELVLGTSCSEYPPLGGAPPPPPPMTHGCCGGANATIVASDERGPLSLGSSLLGCALLTRRRRR